MSDVFSWVIIESMICNKIRYDGMITIYNANNKTQTDVVSFNAPRNHVRRERERDNDPRGNVFSLLSFVTTMNEGT